MYIPKPSQSGSRKWRTFQIKVPVDVADQIEVVQQKSGTYKASYLKLALVLGTAQLAESFDRLEDSSK